MKSSAKQQRKILVIDVGGTHMKCLVTDKKTPVKFKSGPKLTADEMVDTVLKKTKAWHFDCVSIGFPGVVHHGRIVQEPHNLGSGWVGFDFQVAFARPVKVINDAAMQALGGYDGGKMLFLGLGTGLGSAFIIDGVIAAMELGHLHSGNGHNYEHDVGEQGRKRLGNKKWRKKVYSVVEGFSKALQPDYLMLGGGNAAKLKELPPRTRLGDNAYAFTGGFRLWEKHGRAS